ncbi:hypothetical protein [Chryseobacterium polytrichastri]|uniref:Dolichyl-phosphate-mannose-protein mannosyltransferase n=1 Tax=Chryseobacterium polytrichastri TaxID=1302687 RepID=A0A1M7JFJ3_9FLAO|nr:hypothetical protein [Chryseobacterium polytrichastri]SHM51870.1 hypothetical protein SAMN05444267_10529 [Chryseobacterium polytrichastri]
MKNKFIFLLFIVLFFCNSQFNLFHFIPQERFEYSKLEVSETLIIGKLLNSQQGGIFEDGGFTGIYFTDADISSRFSSGKKSYIKYINNEHPKKYYYWAYKSQIGGQAILYSAFDKIFGLDNKVNILIFRMLNSLSLSLLLTLILFWIKKKFGMTTCIISFLLIIPNYWIFVYGKSTWWCNWVYFLPFAYSLFFFERNKTSFSSRKYIYMLSLLFFIKFWFTGFEFITVFLISSSIPYIYYLFENKWSFYFKFIRIHFVIVAVPLVFTVLFQLFQFKLLTGNFEDGIAHLIDAYSRRANGEYSYTGEYAYLNNLKQYHLDILMRYIGGSFVNEDFIKLPFIVIIGLGFFSSVFLYVKNIERKLVFTTWFSILAPLSWLILFKEHAHIHPHIDFFIWYCPFLLLLILVISLTLTFFLKSFKTVF